MNRPIPARPVLLLGFSALCLLTMLGQSGCVPFEAKFAAARNARNPGEPLSGSWIGTWQSQCEQTHGTARLVAETSSPSTCNIWLEMSGYRNVIASWIFAPDVPLERLPDGTERFSIKVPIEGRPTQDVWAVAIQLDGKLSATSLSIEFRTNDAMRELDHGSLRLTRQ